MKDYQVNSIESPLWALVSFAAYDAGSGALTAIAAVLCALSATLALLGHIIERRKQKATDAETHSEN